MIGSDGLPGGDINHPAPVGQLPRVLGSLQPAISASSTWKPRSTK